MSLSAIQETINQGEIVGKPDISSLYQNNMNSLIGRRKYRDRKYRQNAEKKLSSPAVWMGDQPGNAEA